MSRNYRKFYALLKLLPGVEKEDVVYEFARGRTRSLHGMTDFEFDVALVCMGGKAKVTNAADDKFNIWRKRVIACISSYLKLTGGANNINHVKAIAARAAGRKWFNEITISELRTIYNEFLNKQRITKRSAAISVQ